MTATVSGLDLAEVDRVVRTALAEDLAYGGDATTMATVPAGVKGVAELTPREPGVLAGLPVALAVLSEVAGGGFSVLSAETDGSQLEPDRPVLVVEAEIRTLLTAERTMLNLVCQLSGVATLTAAWVDAVAGTRCQVRDTRKTVPGLRLLQKYAVRCGGGVNHRLGLGDAVLVKDNHVVAAGSVTAALEAVRSSSPALQCEIEVDALDQLDEALNADAELVLLDNFSIADCAAAVRRRDDVNPRTRLEASGGLRLDTVRSYAETGIDFVSVGALTHSAPAVDLGLDLR
ncbi:carboxylating nicotinate-nucleotide diphosphorylase [Fodinicola acaciae]|uniref:carboxylating nicotinate-nucleotide diphosphorylase n=1 Tax=Fodinicola acaciae TaxID=2681555 RepID=UPI0013D37A2E|nr:carboxylating nicotinate-nucleotide diphosphorylase [Fodinicola acaciae]